MQLSYRATLVSVTRSLRGRCLAEIDRTTLRAFCFDSGVSALSTAA